MLVLGGLRPGRAKASWEKNKVDIVQTVAFIDGDFDIFFVHILLKDVTLTLPNNKITKPVCLFCLLGTIWSFVVGSKQDSESRKFDILLRFE